MPTPAKKHFDPEDFLTREEFRARFDTEKLALQRHYCTLFKFWRSCRCMLCRRARACKGDAQACLKRSVDRIPREQRFAAKLQLFESTPKNLGAPEYAARTLMPNDFTGNAAAFRPRDIPRGWTRRARRRKT